MKKARHIHVFGASGSGTTTLAAALSERIDYPHFDADYYFWLPSDPPFQKKRDHSERVKMLLADLQAQNAWILSGSICGWDNEITPMFDLAVFLWIPLDIRMARLERREAGRYGDEWRVRSAAFLEWAAQYDCAGTDMRSRLLHENWMKTLHCPVQRLEGDMTVDERVRRVLEAASC